MRRIVYSALNPFRILKDREGDGRVYAADCPVAGSFVHDRERNIAKKQAR
jgi:hypothetical protein